MAQNKTVCLIVGANGYLGCKITNALAMKDNVEVRALVRDSANLNPTLKRLVEIKGVQIFEGDIKEPGTLAQAIEYVDVVVSAVQGGKDVIVDGQKLLLQLCQFAGVKRFIPSDFSVNFYHDISPEEHPMLGPRIIFSQQTDLDKYPNIQIIHPINGCFMEVFWGFLGVYDPKRPSLNFYGSADTPLDFTLSDDMARYIAEAAVTDGPLPHQFEILGDRRSCREIASIYEKVYGKPLTLNCLGTIEDLKQDIARLTSSATTSPTAAIPLQYQLFMFDLRGRIRTPMNFLFPNIQPTKLEEFLRSKEGRAVVLGEEKEE